VAAKAFAASDPAPAGDCDPGNSLVLRDNPWLLADSTIILTPLPTPTSALTPKTGNFVSKDRPAWFPGATETTLVPAGTYDISKGIIAAYSIVFAL
jgi:hypothetical protein